MFLHVVDDHPPGCDAPMRPQDIEDQPRALLLVLEVWGVHEDQLVVLHRQLDVLLQHLELIEGVAIQPDFADPEHVLLVEKIRDHLENIVRERQILRLLGVQAKPTEMREEEFGRAGRFIHRQLTEIIAKAIR